MRIMHPAYHVILDGCRNKKIGLMTNPFPKKLLRK
jgi:hypothetical protein